jgi:FHA domain-containing protein
MSFARRIESRLERLFEGVSATVFGGKTERLDIENKILRTADLEMFEHPTGPSIPNIYALFLHPDNLPRQNIAATASELESVIAETAMDEGWRLSGPVSVALVGDPSLPTRSMRCESQTVQGPQVPWANLLATSGARAYAVTYIRSLIGRDKGCDVQILEADISRNHAVLFAKNQQAWIHDLGSSNGTRVNGITVTSTPVLVRPGDQLTIGDHRFTLKWVHNARPHTPFPSK